MNATGELACDDQPVVRGEDGGGDVRTDADMQVLLAEGASLDDRLAGIELNGGRADTAVVPVNQSDTRWP